MPRQTRHAYDAIGAVALAVVPGFPGELGTGVASCGEQQPGDHGDNDQRDAGQTGGQQREWGGEHPYRQTPATPVRADASVQQVKGLQRFGVGRRGLQWGL